MASNCNLKIFAAVLLIFTLLNLHANEVTKLEDLKIPATKYEDIKLRVVLADLNSTLAKLYPNHPQLPIVIEEHHDLEMSNANKKINLSLTEHTLSIQLHILFTLTMTHCEFSENGLLIYKMWNRQEVDADN